MRSDEVMAAELMKDVDKAAEVTKAVDMADEVMKAVDMAPDVRDFEVNSCVVRVARGGVYTRVARIES